MLRRIFVPTLLVSLLVVVATPPALVAQSGTSSLSAKPRGDSHVAPAGASGGVVVFYVTNTGSVLNRVRLSCGGRDGVTCEGVDVTRLNLEPGETAQIVTTISVGTTSGAVTLQADGTSGSFAAAEWPVTVVTGTAIGGGEAAAAQCGEECGGGGTTYGVDVSNPSPVTKAANSGPYTAYFSVYNSGSTSNTYTLTCSALFGVSCVSVFPFSMTLQSLDDNAAAVTYNVGSSSGTLRLKATGTQATDIGSMGVTAVNQGPPTVAIANRNDDNWDRSMCLVAGAGPGASVCGDLLISHAMPGFQTLGRERALTMVYSSHQAAPEPLVAATVSTPVGNANPTSVHADLWVLALGSDQLVRSADYTAWTGTGDRQLALSFDASGYPTGAYQYSLTVTYVYPGGSYSTIASGTLVIVNRSQSSLGQGWSMAGVEELYFNQPAWTVGATGLLWVGGDGSAKLYSQVPGTTDRWVAPMGAYRDTIVDTGAGYSRYLRHGVEVTYDGTGKHLKTINRVGQETVFAWSSGRLASITVPPEGVSGRTYTITYDGNSKLDKITDPGGRILDATVSFGRITSLKDPDNITLTFGYNGDGRMISRKNRGGYTTGFSYASGLHLTKVDVPYGSFGITLATTTFEPWDHKGFASVGSGPFAAQTASTVYTKVVGPRLGINDDAKFWVDKWGAPTRIDNALGHTRIIERGGDARFPALVTKVTEPNLMYTTLTYDARANLTEERHVTSHLPDGLPDTYTQWEYTDPDAPDSPSMIHDALGRSQTFSYNALQLPDSVRASNNHTTAFEYQMSGSLKGLLLKATERSVNVWVEADSASVVKDLVTEFHYDPLGNLAWDSVTPGLLTSHVRDAYGRVIQTYGRDRSRRDLGYDALNRVTESTQYTTPWDHPVLNPYGTNIFTVCDADQINCSDMSDDNLTPAAPGNKLITSYAFGPFGLVTVTDPRGVTRSYDYTARGLAYREEDEFGLAKVASYDPAGLMSQVITRDTLTLTYTYDAIGRREKLIYPAKLNTIPNNGSATIPGDSVTYSYDDMGNLLAAQTSTSEIRRTYYPNGWLKDKLTVSPASDSLRYRYDATGAVTWIVFEGRDSVQYAYDGSTGELTSVTAYFENEPSLSFGFTWDKLGRRKTVTYPVTSGTMTLTYQYDALGVQRRVYSHNTQDPLNVTDRFDFEVANLDVDPAGRILHQRTQCHTWHNTWGEGGTPDPYMCGADQITERQHRYNRLGMLVIQDNLQLLSTVDTMLYDASGNMTDRRHFVAGSDDLDAFVMQAGSNRLDYDTRVGRSVNVYQRYNGRGARQYEEPTNHSPSYAPLWKLYYYDGLGRTSGVRKFVDAGGSLGVSGQPDDCRYDADGRMTGPCDDLVWLAFDGDQTTKADLGLDSSWRFVHGPGLDDPLVGYLRRLNGSTATMFVTTDGNGRQFTVGDPTGSGRKFVEVGNQEDNMWRMAGTVTASFGFDSERMAPSGAADLSTYRNRVYDSRTGRWTQEDPIGIAGGINMYQFNGNNPVSNTDPFGLMPCDPPGSCVAKGTAIGMGIGATAGVIVATGCATSTGGVCALAAPVIINAGATIGATLGAAFGVLLQASDDRTAGQIISDEKRGSIRRRFPGEMLGKTLDQIQELAKKGEGKVKEAARRAKKLLKDKRFDKDSSN